ncbi:MFS transporter [Rhodococcus sp. NPDC056960]|uniref:MFS transporter n=1 Tax=Rhodococcus sp. NPDC056960 TaxID=3345982 RepID=UPI00362F5A0E
MLDTEVSSSTARTAGLGRLFAFLLPATTAMYAAFNGVSQILVPSQVEGFDPGAKVGNLAVVTALAALSAVMALPLGGAVSDRTRSRFGRRSPWILAMSVLSAALLLVMGLSTGIVVLACAYVAVWFTANFYQGAFSAILPDRVPVSRRGLASSVIGLGTPLGIMVGVNVASRVGHLWAYAIFDVAFVVTSAALVLGAREPSSADAVLAPRTSRRVSETLRAFFVAFRSKDFTLAFLSRASLSLAYFTVSGYLFYAMQDYIGVENIPDGDVAVAVSTLSTISVVTWAVVAVFTGWLADRLDRRKLFVGISAAGLAVSMLVPISSPSWSGMVVYAFLSGAFIGTYFAVDLAVMSLVLPDKANEGRDFGLLAVATGLPPALASVVAGALLTVFGSYVALFVFGAACAFVAGLVIMRIRSIR